jgi:hypothetical protein
MRRSHVHSRRNRGHGGRHACIGARHDGTWNGPETHGANGQRRRRTTARTDIGSIGHAGRWNLLHARVGRQTGIRRHHPSWIVARRIDGGPSVGVVRIGTTDRRRGHERYALGLVLVRCTWLQSRNRRSVVWIKLRNRSIVGHGRSLPLRIVGRCRHRADDRLRDTGGQERAWGWWSHPIVSVVASHSTIGWHNWGHRWQPWHARSHRERRTHRVRRRRLLAATPTVKPSFRARCRQRHGYPCRESSQEQLSCRSMECGSRCGRSLHGFFQQLGFSNQGVMQRSRQSYLVPHGTGRNPACLKRRRTLSPPMRCHACPWGQRKHDHNRGSARFIAESS